VFAEPTGTVLLFDGGGETALAVHLDTGTHRRIPLKGQRAGDQPFRLWRLGDEVVVGWGEVYAVTPAGGASRHLASATVFLPAAAPDQLWLIDIGSGGGPATWRLIDADGEQVARVEMPVGGLEPIRGVPGGLAVRSPTGALLKYDLATEQLVNTYGNEALRIADVGHDRVAWCDADPCAALTVSGPGGDHRGSLSHPEEVFLEGQVWLSPEGHYAAAVVRSETGDAVDFHLRVYHMGTSEVLADAPALLGSAYGQWSDDGEQFFSWTQAPGGCDAPAVLSRWTGGEDIERVDVRELGITGCTASSRCPRHRLRVCSTWRVKVGGSRCAPPGRCAPSPDSSTSAGGSGRIWAPSSWGPVRCPGENDGEGRH
jgi:hypothetical protein